MAGVQWLQSGLLMERNLVHQQAPQLSVLNEVACLILELSPLSIIMHPKVQGMKEIKMFGSHL